MSPDGLVPVTIIHNFNRVKTIVMNIQMMGIQGDIIKDVISTSTLCEFKNDGIRLKSGYEYWIMPTVKTDSEIVL